ncbi:MAG: IPT/TIG domain-containing protein [Prevotella sp.]|nr:IPT/TIG domain-containing protein [Prevotella sp.]
MKKQPINNLFPVLIAAVAMLLLSACSKDDTDAPRIDSVWMNMVSRPVEQVVCAYPGQTICLRGDHLGDVRRIIVNGTDINLNTLYVYESATALTFQLPSDVNTTGDNIRVVTKWGMCDYAFIIRPATEKPTITSFSATTLTPGRILTITGTNLTGAKEVWLPLAFNGRVQCELDTEQESGGTTVRVIIPDDVDFATGQCEIIMEKNDAVRGITYTEKVYSASTDFRN